MADVESITASYSRKVQLEQFEPIEHSVELNVSLDEGDDAEEVHKEYADVAEDMVERAIANRLAAKQMKDADSE